MRVRGQAHNLQVGIGALLVAVAVIAACGTGLGELRRHTYGPGFNYLTQDQLETTMGRFARLVTQLNAVMAADADPEIDAAERAHIIELLRRLEHEAQALGPGGWPSNHPRISRHVDSLRRDLERARQAAEREPPNYYWAGSISGACSYCHAPPV
jgi:hypothetical protein